MESVVIVILVSLGAVCVTRTILYFGFHFLDSLGAYLDGKEEQDKKNGQDEREAGKDN
tara:strand:+ start:110 stop:283 length:174 start_codon:yes stop_codon:yes gene_type:complete